MLSKFPEANCCLRRKIDLLVKGRIDPYANLKDVLTRLPKINIHQIDEIIPSAWAKSHLQVRRLAES